MVSDPGSRIRKKPIPDPGSRGQKGTGSRIRNNALFPEEIVYSRFLPSYVQFCQALVSLVLILISEVEPFF